MHDPFIEHDELAKAPSAPCHMDAVHAHEGGRVRPHHEHDHDHAHGGHTHDGRPHVHLPDGTVRYLEEGELPSAPKRRRSPSKELQ